MVIYKWHFIPRMWLYFTGQWNNNRFIYFLYRISLTHFELPQLMEPLSEVYWLYGLMKAQVHALHQQLGVLAYEMVQRLMDEPKTFAI